MDNQFLKAALQSKLYQKKLSHLNIDEWHNIPFTTKADLRNADTFDVLGVDLHQVATYHETSGTSGKPSPSWMSHNDTKQEGDFVKQSDIQLNEKDVILNRFPFAIALPAFILYWAARRTKAGFISADQWNATAPISRVVDILQKTKPTILAIGSNEAIKLYHVAKALNVQFPLENLRALIVAGELVSPARRKYIEQLWGVPVYMLFGSTETGSLSFSCKEGHFHLNHPKVKFEVVDDDGQVLPFNQKGNCVISAAREGMPLLRYFNEDYVEIKEGHTCDCGDEHPLLIHYGRRNDSVTVNNKVFSFYDIQEAVYSLSEIPFMWEIIQLNDSLNFSMQFTKDINLNDISEQLSVAFGTPVSVELNELVPIESLIEHPPLSKSTYIRKMLTEEATTK